MTLFFLENFILKKKRIENEDEERVRGGENARAYVREHM